MPYKIFGCKVNKFYINQRLQHYKEQNNGLDTTLLIATCVVTDRAKSKRIKDAKKTLEQGQRVAITGCGTLEKGELISAERFFSIYPELRKFNKNIDLLPESPTKLGKGGTFTPLYTKNFVVIQNGCDNHCSFCLTVLKRGKHRSRSSEEIIEEIQFIESRGGKEVVLTGVNLAARGANNSRKTEESRFSQLLEEILQQTTIPRVRISSIGPEFVNDHFFELASDERILPHFHYSIQSFSDKVLQNMKRGYGAEKLKDTLRKTRRIQKKNPESISIGADIIVGFPGETEADFLETFECVQEFGITKLHAFPFSAHQRGEGVPASLYPNQISIEIKKDRNKRLIERGERIRDAFIQRNKGITHKVLIEEQKAEKRKGRTENYIQVELEGNYKKGEIIEYLL
ncbi:MAG: radical SAM protein [Candidatus Absconditabacteria bacterium]|nr:radical SAM protein [Candidatus Absconditabacteria bacterium]